MTRKDVLPKLKKLWTEEIVFITSVPLSLALLCRDFVSSPDSTPSLSTYYKITLINTYRFLLDYVLEQQTMPTHGVNKFSEQYNLNSEPKQMDLEITWSTWIGLFTTVSNSLRIWKYKKSNRQHCIGVNSFWEIRSAFQAF